ncbi:MAG TPA: tetratricopeptide repeat protein, partial [Aquabacterium sp.]|nr:tetratricopeptide repeat protein [Aquabacterium sp.]
TQAPGLTPTEGTQPTPGAVQGEVIVSPASEGAASQAASQTEAQANVPVTASASSQPPTPPTRPSQSETAPAATPKATTTTGASSRVKAAGAVASATPARPGDSNIKPAQLVRSQTQQQLQNAWAALRQGDAVRAQTLYQQVLAERPDDPDAAVGLAVSLHRQRQLQPAWAAYQRSLQVWPDNETARTGMLSILSESDPDTAESRLQEWVQSRPRDAAAQAALGNLLGKQGRWAQALGPLTQAQSLAPNSAAHAYNLAVALDQARRYDEALQMYRLTQQLGSAGVPEPTLQRRIQELQGASAR